MENNLDWSYNKYAICPYCGFEDIDSFELYDDEITECPSCGKEYGVIRNIEITYTTYKPMKRKCDVDDE